MNEQEFKKQLTGLLANPPKAPVNEYHEILCRIQSREQSVWALLKPAIPAFALLLFVVLFVSPKNQGAQNQSPSQQSVYSFYSEDTSLSTDIFCK